jgi:large subunit ribosomal protein L17
MHTTKFNRNYNQRKALFKSQLQSLITWGKLTTTQPKAKVIKRLFDKMVTRALKGTVAARRLLAGDLSSQPHADRLVDVIAPHLSDRKSGFTTIEKTSVRRGDAVILSTIRFVKQLPVIEAVKEEKKVKVEKKEVKKTTKKAK